MLAILLALPFRLDLVPGEFDPDPETTWVWGSLAFLLLLQISALLLNLLPLPPLDGYGILEPWLPPSWQTTGAKIRRTLVFRKTDLRPPAGTIRNIVCEPLGRQNLC